MSLPWISVDKYLPLPTERVWDDLARRSRDVAIHMKLLGRSFYDIAKLVHFDGDKGCMWISDHGGGIAWEYVTHWLDLTPPVK